MSSLNFSVWLVFLITFLFGWRGAPKSRSGHRELVSAHGLVLIMFFMFLILPATTPVFLSANFLYWAPAFSGSTEVLSALALSWFSLVIFLMSYVFFRVRPEAIPASVAPDKILPSPILIAVLLSFIGIGLFLKILAVKLGGGMEQTIIRMSGGVSANLGLERTGSGFLVLLRSTSVIADISASWLLILALIQRRYRLATATIFLAVIAVSIGITGKRLFILWPLLAVSVAISQIALRLTPKHAVLALPAALFLGWITLSYRIFMPLSAAGMSSSFDMRMVPWAGGTMWGFYFNSLEFSYFEFTVASIWSRDAVISMFGGQLDLIYKTQIEPFFYIIPRAVWPGKPELFLDLSHALTSLVTYVDIEVVGSGIAASLVGTSFLSGGMIGVVLAFLVLGFAAARIDRFYYAATTAKRASPLWTITYAFLLMVVFHLFRQGTFGWVFMIGFVQQLGGLFALGVIWIVSVQFPATIVSNDAPKKFP